MITKNDLKVIKECLVASGVKNSEFQESTDANKDAYIAFVYNNQNYKIKVSNLIPIKNISLDGITLIPDDNGKLNIELPKSKWDVIPVNYYGNTPPPPQAQEGALCYNKSEKSLWRYQRPGGWKQVPWEENFYYIKGLDVLCLYISELGLLEIPKDKQDKLVSGVNIKTINGNSILGSGDIIISGEGTFTSFPTLLPIKGTVVTTENNTNTTEVLNVGEDKSVYYDYRLEKFVVKTLQNVYYTQWEGDYSTSEQYESISFVYTEYPETTIYKIDKTRPNTLLPISDCSIVEIVEWTNNAEDHPLGYDYPEGSYAISEDYLYRLIDGNWTLIGNTIDSISSYNKRYYLIYENALYTFKITDGVTPVIVPVSQDTIDTAIAPINQQLVTINNKLEQDEEDIQDLKLITNILQGQRQSPLQVAIVTTDRGIAERTYTGTKGELCYVDGSLYKGFAWRVGNTYYSNWTNVKPLPANLVGIDIIFEEKEGILYFYKITESGLEQLSMQDVAARNYKELLPIEQIVDGLIIASQDAPIPGGIVIYNPTRKRFYYKDADSQTYHSVWSDDLGVPSSDDYQHADFVYMVDTYLQIYKITTQGLIGINTINSAEFQEEISNTIKNRLCTVIAYEGEDSQEKMGPWRIGEIWYDTINYQFFVCTHEGAIPETEITIPDSCLLYVEQPNGRFYYYNSAQDTEPIPLQTIDPTLNGNSVNPVENRAIVTALNNKQDKLSIEDEVIQNSENVVTSGAVYQAIQQILPEVSPEMAFTPGDGINIYEEIDDATDTRRVVISLSDTALRKLNYDIPALLQRVEQIEQKLREKFPDDPVPVVVEFDPTVGNWGAIHLQEDPEEIDVADVMSAYTVTDLADITDENISVWATGDAPPEGSYYITAEKAGLVHYSTGRLDLAYANRKVLCDITSDTGTYANCVGLVLGYDGNPETYYFDFLPGDGSTRSCTVSGTTYTYQTVDEGLLTAIDKYWDRGIVIKKNFTIKGMTFDTNNLPTSGLLMSASHDGHVTGGPFFYTRHSLDLIGVNFTQRSGYDSVTQKSTKAACVVIDDVDGIDQVQIKDCQFAVTGDLYQSAHAITLLGRDESPLDPVTNELKETNCIKDLLIYNNTFAGGGCIMGIINGSGYTNISDNYQYARFLNTCRIVGNTFTSASYCAINLAYQNDNREYPLTTAFTQCPVYIVGNTIEGKPGIINGGGGTQHCGIIMKVGRLFVLHNTIRDYVVRQSDGSTTAFAYATSVALYFCNNTCENLAKFSANNRATLVLYKTDPIPTNYRTANTRYETVRYIYGNTFKQDINTINTWWTNWLNSTSATTTDRSLDFDTCLGVPVLSMTGNAMDSITIKNNVFNIRTIYGISPYSTSLAKNFIIEDNTFNFGVQKFYQDNSFSGIFTVGDIGGEQMNITIRNNRFVTGLSTVRLLTLMNLSGDPVSITFDGNSVPDNIVLNKQEARSNSTNVTTTPIYNDNGDNIGYIIIPSSEITTEEAMIINGINS